MTDTAEIDKQQILKDGQDKEGQAVTNDSGKLFPDLDPDDPELSVTEVESLCMNCHEQGTTKLLLTRVPYFKDVVISSFTCPSCGYESRSTDLTSRIHDNGIVYELQVRQKSDLNRQLVRARGAEIRLPQLDSAFPCSESSVSTVEGVLSEVVENLKAVIEAMADGEALDKLRDFVNQLTSMYQCQQPSFTIQLYDPSGNSFLENPLAPKPDPNLKVYQFTRSEQQDRALGILPDEDDEEEEEGEEEVEDKGNNADAAGDASDEKRETSQSETIDAKFDKYAEVMTFQVNCPNCDAETENRMKAVQVPYFKEVVVMATNCEKCGFKDSSVKCGGGIEPLGIKLDLHVQEEYDLSRDVLVSETCMISIPELDFQTEQGSLGGKFTTVEGLLEATCDSLAETNPCLLGDAASSDELSKFLEKLRKFAKGEQLNYHLVLDDAAGNSYIQNVCAPDPDPQLVRAEYERTFEQNEILGLNDMKTENYAAAS